jgi:hypothetical protein
MKTKILVALGFLAGFTIMISACSEETPNAVSSTRDDYATLSSSAGAPPSPNTTTSSSESANPTSSESTIPQSSDSQKSSSSEKGISSSSVFFPRMSSSWPDGGNYNPAACCVDTIYIENGQETYHRLQEGICPPPIYMTVSCYPPVRVNMDSIKAIESKPKEPSILIEECLQAIDLAKQGLGNEIKKAKLIDDHGSFKVEFWKQDYCSIDAGISFERSGDTLSLKLTDIRSAETCKCYSKHRIDIPASEKDFSYFKFEDKVFEVQ